MVRVLPLVSLQACVQGWLCCRRTHGRWEARSNCCRPPYSGTACRQVDTGLGSLKGMSTWVRALLVRKLAWPMSGMAVFCQWIWVAGIVRVHVSAILCVERGWGKQLVRPILLTLPRRGSTPGGSSLYILEAEWVSILLAMPLKDRPGQLMRLVSARGFSGVLLPTLRETC